MKKWISIWTAIGLFFLILPLSSFAESMQWDINDDVDEMDCTKEMDFSPETKKKLDEIYQRIYMGYVDLIELYYWKGALTEHQKNTRNDMLKNYILTFGKENYRWCSEHENDEWEEEWYNSDEGEQLGE
ncbi:DUF2680 domain-containing protein [Pueribacillus theae]|uniref:DUF2680 domain-containing protein n=1 Tax=Pueribacillus theae TaxID=2171751 RepID=A0A2U1JW42_9BACI|nr:DUF2680 domain-containing protein [Pueribacillus theae]PWA09043.1 DUF2680 domain-containing protein [Pueribacillus theae]